MRADMLENKVCPDCGEDYLSREEVNGRHPCKPKSVADEIIAMLEDQKAFYEEAIRVSSPPIKNNFTERSSAISGVLEQAKRIKARSEVSE